MPRHSDEEDTPNSSESNTSLPPLRGAFDRPRRQGPPGSTNTSRTTSATSLNSRQDSATGPSRPSSRPGSGSGDDHSFREQVASQYMASALNKARLRYCIFFHYFLSFAMLAKLTPFFLDRFNFFILAIEELQVPEPFAWEWIWLSSFTLSMLALDAIKRNNIHRMKQYMYGLGLLGLCPLLYAIFYWLPEVIVFLTMSYDDPNYNYLFDPLDDIAYWKGLPCGVLWLIFIFLAVQIHAFQLYFSLSLVKAWLARGIPQE